jgi:hypothetical protein
MTAARYALPTTLSQPSPALTSARACDDQSAASSVGESGYLGGGVLCGGFVSSVCVVAGLYRRGRFPD